MQSSIERALERLKPYYDDIWVDQFGLILADLAEERYNEGFDAGLTVNEARLAAVVAKAQAVVDFVLSPRTR
jgi:hypothetical protein